KLSSCRSRGLSVARALHQMTVVCGRFVTAASLSNGYPTGGKLPLLSMNRGVMVAQEAGA
ncbi:MAG: hypothetical protein ACRCWT_10140, partial [Aeromonas veronii]